MRRLVVLALLLQAALFACSRNNGTGVDGGPDGRACNPPSPCAGGEVCRYDACVPPPEPCTSNLDCTGDAYCDTSASECLPWGVGPNPEDHDPACKRDPVPGVFFPGAQCEWVGPPDGDPFPEHKNVLSTPVVASFYRQDEFIVPSIVFTSYNYTDGGAEAASGTNPNYFGVIRLIDGRTCTQQATISSPTVIAAASLAVADLGGRDAIPEIVAARTQGGLVAFTLGDNGWEVLWETTSQFADNLQNWAGPSIHDLDDDGVPEVLFYGAVYDGRTGATIDESIAGSVDDVGTGYIPVVADLDGDGNAELVTGTRIYTWDRTNRRWSPTTTFSGTNNGFTAVADFGTFPESGPDDRGTKDGIPEIVVVYYVAPGGIAKVFNIHGRELFSARLVGGGMPAGTIGRGGPPTIADFDGDGRVEFASAGASAYHVFDPDCVGTPDPATCPSMRTDGISWVQQSQDFSSNRTGSTVFDFDGDGRAEVVYGDECFTRVYDGLTGRVVYSRFRTSCTWYEMPIVVDVDADYNAEIVSTSNTNCSTTCPAVDPIFDGVQCFDDSDCPSAAPCVREQPGDELGRCRCTQDSDCGGDGFVCLDPIAGPSPAGKVCRASHPATPLTGIRVLADGIDRWVNTRGIWNQHAYSVTNIDDAGRVPRTSAWVQNWTQPTLNNYRQNAPGEGQTAGAIPDLTVKRTKASCEGAGTATITAEVCNRGTEPVAQGLPVAVYADGTPPELRCTALTNVRLFPGGCATVSCTWSGPSGTGFVAVDDRGDATGTNLECREDNNRAAVTVSCP